MGSMYFESREIAGQQLASDIASAYGGQQNVVVALSDGGVVVASEIALTLNTVLMMLLTEHIDIPQENTSIAGVTQGGAFSYNNAYSSGEIDEFVGEYHNFIEQEKLNKLRHINELTGHDSLLREDLMVNNNIILVSDGIRDGFSIDLAMAFLKPIKTKKIIMAAPFASVAAVDRMHVLADGLFCLNVIEDYISTNHYYNHQDLPSHEDATKAVRLFIDHWGGDKQPDGESGSMITRHILRPIKRMI